MKAVVSATMGAFDTFANGKERVEGRRALNEIRSKLAQGENVPVMITVPDIDENSPDFMKDYYGYYRTDRGYHKRSINSGCGWNPTTFLSHYTNDTLTATLAQNSSGEALKKLLEDGPMTISMRDYGDMEKVGDIGTSLPTNDEQITTEAGDLILYMGSAFVIYYAPNSWNFTRLGKIDNITVQELKNILGDGSVEVTLSLR